MEEDIARLQAAARRLASRLVPGVAVDGLQILDANGRVLFAVAIPQAACEPAEGPREEPPAAAGWDVTERRALYDGRRVKVAPSRLKLLKVLAEATEKLSAKELARLAFDAGADEENARYHVKSLRTELKAAFADFEGDLLPGDGGYRLALR